MEYPFRQTIYSPLLASSPVSPIRNENIPKTFFFSLAWAHESSISVIYRFIPSWWPISSIHPFINHLLISKLWLEHHLLWDACIDLLLSIDSTWMFQEQRKRDQHNQQSWLLYRIENIFSFVSDWPMIRISSHSFYLQPFWRINLLMCLCFLFV